MIFTEQLALGALLGKILRQRYGLKVLMGGSCFTDSAEDFFRFYPDSADVIIAGEGEDALKALLCNLDSPQAVPGARCSSATAIYKRFPDHFAMILISLASQTSVTFGSKTISHRSR